MCSGWQRSQLRAWNSSLIPLVHYVRNNYTGLERTLYTRNLLVDELLNHARAAGNKHRGGERLRVVCEHLLPFTESARMAWLVLTAFNGRAIGDQRLTAIQLSRYTKCRQFFETEITLAKEAGILDAAIEPGLEAIALASFVDGLALQMLFLGKAEAKRAREELVRRYLERSFGITLNSRRNVGGAIAGAPTPGRRRPRRAMPESPKRGLG
jgi:hypothetical protein